MTSLCERLVTDVSGQLAFGHELETQTKDENRFLPRAMMGRLALAVAWPTLYIIGINKLIVWWNKAKFNAFRTLLTRIISTRVALLMDAKFDFYSIAATEAGKSSEKLSLTKTRELWGEAMFLVPAGGMETAGTLMPVFVFLSRHPTAYTWLVSKIRTTFPDAQAIRSGPLLASRTYLRAVVDESLRISVPTTSIPWREKETSPNAGSPSKPFIIDGHVIPPGTMVVVNTYCTMHHEAYFPDLLAFQLERWLDETNERMVAGLVWVSSGVLLGWYGSVTGFGKFGIGISRLHESLWGLIY